MTPPPLPPAPSAPAGSTRPPGPALPALPWHARLNVLNVTLLLFVLAVVFSAPALRGSGRDLAYWDNTVRFLGRFFPPDFSVLPQVLISLIETAQIAVMATFFAMFIALLLGALGARTIAPRWVVVATRLLLNGIRTVPSLLWALIAVAIVGANPLAGVIGLMFYSLGYLGKFFADAFESVDVEVARALRALGAHPVQAFQHGVWPHARPLVWSYGLWMLEYNLRSAAIIGYVGAGGLGVLLHSYQEYYAWDKFATVLLCILVLVTALDLLGEWVRSRITKKTGGKPAK